MNVRPLQSLFAVLCLAFATAAFAAAPAVKTIRVPGGGVQPQAAVDADGTAHLIYLTGDPKASDIQYVRMPAGRETFGAPLRVNTHPGSALAIGTIRGPHMALGREGLVHVAWMGSDKAEPRQPYKGAPMLYTRLGKDGAFEAERNLVTTWPGLDGGGAVAADDKGNVYVGWHAPAKHNGDESTRRVWVAYSIDDGTKFHAEVPLSGDALGVCACCGMELLAPAGDLLVGLYRTADRQVHRDTRAFVIRDKAERRFAETLDPCETGTCQMSTYAMAALPAGGGFVAAWETLGRIRFGVYALPDAKAKPPHDVPGGDSGCKHPAVAVDEGGNILIAWAVGTGWEKGGSVAWQVFDRDLRPIDGAAGRAAALPAWSRPAALAAPGGGFVVIY